MANRKKDMNKSIPEKYVKWYSKTKRSMKIAIQLFCLECCGFDRIETKKCENIECPLIHHNPYRRKRLIEEGKIKIVKGDKKLNPGLKAYLENKKKEKEEEEEEEDGIDEEL